MPGSLTSLKTTSNGCAVNARSASSAFAADSMWRSSRLEQQRERLAQIGVVFDDKDAQHRSPF